MKRILAKLAQVAATFCWVISNDYEILRRRWLKRAVWLQDRAHSLSDWPPDEDEVYTYEEYEETVNKMRGDM